MSTMLQDFLKEHQIEETTLVKVSKALESHTEETRRLAIARATARRTKKSYADANLDKPAAYGRGLSIGTIKRAVSGKPLPRITRKKIVRAVNVALASQKKDPIEWRQIFADAPKKGGKKS